MRFPGRLYNGTGNQYLAIYNHHKDICVAAPPSIRGGSRRVAHIAYSEGGKRSGIDLFLLDNPVRSLGARVKKTSKGDRTVFVTTQIPEIEFVKSLEGQGSMNSDRRYDIGYEVLPGTPEELFGLVRADIERYCKRDAKTQEGGINFVQQIVPVTTLQADTFSYVLTSGKQDFTPQCLFEGNIDFSQGCITSWLPQKGASFDGDTFRGFFLDPFSECGYCYAGPKHKSFPKNMIEIDFDRLKWELRGAFRPSFEEGAYGKYLKVLRAGKRTEVASDYTLSKLMLTLEACADTGTRMILPTKMARFSSGLAELLKKSDSVILPSIGIDELEVGACAHGCTNEWRLEQAVKFAEAGVRTVPYMLVVNPSAEPTKRDQELLKFFNSRKNVFAGVQILPMRFGSKELCLDCTGYQWDFLKSRLDQQKESFEPFEGQELVGSFVRETSGLLPNKLHNDWLSLVGKNHGFYRMCHHTSSETYCGSCFLGPGSLTPRRKVVVVSHKKKELSKAKLPLFDDGRKD